MKRSRIVPLLLLASLAGGQTPPPGPAVPAPAVVAGAEPACFGGAIRISALVSAGGRVRVGIVETATKRSYLVSPGERAGDVEVLSADYDKEQVVLRRGNDTCTLSLASDPDVVHPALNLAPPVEPVFRGEAIEKFLRENPNAVTEGLVKFPLPVLPPAVGKGEGIEKFLREHPELKGKVDQPVVGRGEGIESFLKAHPEVKVFDGEVPEGSFGPGIDAALKANPQVISNPPAARFPPAAPAAPR